MLLVGRFTSNPLCHHFNGVMACKATILADPDLFMLGVSFIRSGTTITGGKRHPIVPFLRDLEISDMLKTEDGKSFVGARAIPYCPVPYKPLSMGYAL